MAMDLLGIQLFHGITSPSSDTSHFLSELSSEAHMVTCSGSSQEGEISVGECDESRLGIKIKQVVKDQVNERGWQKTLQMKIPG